MTDMVTEDVVVVSGLEGGGGGVTGEGGDGY